MGVVFMEKSVYRLLKGLSKKEYLIYRVNKEVKVYLAFQVMPPILARGEGEV